MLASISEAIKVSTEKKNKKKDNDTFYWSEGSISVGKIGDTSISSSRQIDTNAITFGSDRFTKNNGIFEVSLLIEMPIHSNLSELCNCRIFLF